MVHWAEQLAHGLDTVYNLSSPELAHLVRQCTETFADWCEAVPMPLMVTDYWGNIYEVNQAAAAVFHRRSQWLVRKPLVVFVPLQDHYAFRILLHHLMQGEPQKWEGHLQPRWGPPISVTLAAAALPLTYSVIPRLLWLTRETPS